MNLGFCPFASSSRGNCYLIKSDTTALLLDIGISGVTIINNLEALGMTVGDIDGVLLTHEHTDHVRCINKMVKSAKEARFFATEGTLASMGPKGDAIPASRLDIIHKDQSFTVGDIEVRAFELSHDAAEPVAYSFQRKGKKIAVVTDTGVVTPSIEEAIKDADILVLESNHEVNILLYGRYPYNVKHRILSDSGHLSNEAAGRCICSFLANRSSSAVPRVFLAHLSKENNTPQQALLTVKNILEEEDYYIGKHLGLEVIGKEYMGELVKI